ncbi:MAG: GGDEF domain-containing protein [Oscillospiraceae bacterium]|nr:GGDEF domain-containing protein [Oscillospiraceae bacterium]
MEINERMTILEFYSLFEELSLAMTDERGMAVPRIERILIKICTGFRMSKAVTQFFRSVRHEQEGDGETLCCFDTGREGHPVLRVRVTTSTGVVATCVAYMTDDVRPLSPFEKEKAEMVMRAVLSYVSRNRLMRVVEDLTFHDQEGFHNLRYYQYRLSRCNEERRLGGKAAIHYNLRHFSLVNQEIGRKAGDVAIRSHYGSMESLVGESGTVCRLGGDNFVALCDRDKLDAVLTYLTEAPVVYDREHGSRIEVAASAGVYCIPEGFVMHDPGEIMDKIMTSSLAARSSGKASIVFYETGFAEVRERAIRIQKRFPEALRNEEFQVYYQPKVNIETGELSGAEALCRWFRGGTMIPPGDFIPVLEETTDICKLDFYMLDHVCQDIRRWLDQGRHVVRVSVNLSRRHMMDIDLLQNILRIIDRSGVPHEYIEIELTETTTDVEFRDLKRVVGGLQQAGVYTSVDDFGVGYSSLNLIREIPWNVLKVDRCFLPMEGDDLTSTRSIMFRHVVAMAKEIGLECIAEGVETKDQLDILRENHCRLAQGFFYDKPLPVEQFEERMSKRYYEGPAAT